MVMHLNKEEATKDLVKGLVRESGMTDLDQLVDCLRKEPYELKNDEILKAFNDLAEEGELEVSRFYLNAEGQPKMVLSDEEPFTFLDDGC